MSSNVFSNNSNLFSLTDLRREFPILNQTFNKQPLVYLDNAATTQKPLSVINSIHEYYTTHNANVHRGVHTLSIKATELHEEARKKLASFINAEPQEMIFTSGTTHGINIIARGLSFEKGDEIFLTEQEHHSNILPWQKLRDEKGIILKIIPLNDNLRPDWNYLYQNITERTRLISFVHVSNTLGNINPVQEIIQQIRLIKPDVWVLLDGAQSFPHLKINIKKLNPDFFVFSMHKAYGPTGIGGLYINRSVQHNVHPLFTGGGTIRDVSWDKTEYERGPVYFEPGSPNMEGAYASMHAIRFLEDLGMENIFMHDKDLTAYAIQKLSELEEVSLFSKGDDICGAVSFNVKNIHPYDVGVILDRYGIAVRTGHHCTQPLMKKLKIPGTIRVSFAIYNTHEEIDFFIDKLKKAIKMLR